MRRGISSSMNPVEITSYDDYLIQGRSPYSQRRFPMKTFIVGVVLLIGGIVFLSVGLSIMFSPILSHGKDRGLLFLILGGIMFTPGSYSSFIIYASYRGWPGYDYSLLPSYEDEN